MESAFKAVYTQFLKGTIGERDWGTIMVLMYDNIVDMHGNDVHLKKWIAEVRATHQNSRR